VAGLFINEALWKVSMKYYHVLLADNHLLIRNGIIRFLTEIPFVKIAGEAKDSSELSELLNKLTIDLVIINITMRPNAIENVIAIKEKFPQIKILFYVLFRDRKILHQALFTGAEGFILEEDFSTEIEKAISTIMEGNIYISLAFNKDIVDLLIKNHHDDLDKGAEDPLISQREREVINLITEGNTSRQIADKLFISVRTVHRHRENIMRKLGMRKTTDLIKYAIKRMV
jgi:DNA-binding NarL/FixJ family response regulator